MAARRRLIKRQLNALLTLLLAVVTMWAFSQQSAIKAEPLSDKLETQYFADKSPTEALSELVVKGRASKTGYKRSQFGDGWARTGNCDTRNIILNRDLMDPIVDDQCRVQSGVLNDPYTAQTVMFTRGDTTSAAVQIDHVVALSDAWQKGAQLLEFNQRVALANDPLNLLAVDGAANQAKGDGDAATWLPPNKAFRCQYIARQIAVKAKYGLWVTQAEKDSMTKIMASC